MQEKNYKIPRVKRLARKRIRHIDLEAVDKLIVASIWHENRLGYLSLDIICSKKRTVLRSRKTVSFEEQIMSKDKYLTQHIFLPNRAYCVYYPSNSFCNMCGFENQGIISDIPKFQLRSIWSCHEFRPIVHEQRYLKDYNSGYLKFVKHRCIQTAPVGAQLSTVTIAMIKALYLTQNSLFHLHGLCLTFHFHIIKCIFNNFVFWLFAKCS